MFVVVIFHLFYVLVKICVVFVVELTVKYGRELTLTRYMHPLQYICVPVNQRSFQYSIYIINMKSLQISTPKSIFF